MFPHERGTRCFAYRGLSSIAKRLCQSVPWRPPFVFGSTRSSNQTASPRAIRSDHPVSIPVASATPQHLAWAPDLSVSCQEGARFVLHSRIAVGVVVIEHRSRVDA